MAKPFANAGIVSANKIRRGTRLETPVQALTRRPHGPSNMLKGRSSAIMFIFTIFQLLTGCHVQVLLNPAYLGTLTGHRRSNLKLGKLPIISDST